MSKNILLITQNFYPVIGSSGNRNKNIYQLLKEKGYDVTVLTTEPAYPNKNLYKDHQFWDDPSLNDDKNIIRLEISTKKFENQIIGRLMFYLEITYLFIKKVRQMKKTSKFDYVYVSTPPIFIFLAGLLAKKDFKSEMILDVRDLWPDSLIGVKKMHYKPILKVFQWLEKKMYNAADKIIINSEGFRNHILSKLKKEKPLTFMPNGAREFELQQEDGHQDFSVIYTGNLGLAQDVERIQELAKRLHAEDIQMKVIGYGYKSKNFNHFIQSEQLDNITVIEPTTRHKCLEAIRSSDVGLAFLNHAEVFNTVLPGKIMDYITCQTPVIGSVDGQAAKLIEDHQVGYVTRSGELDFIVNSIKKLKENPTEKQKLKENCQTLINTHFLWEHNIEKLVKLIK